MNTPSKPNWDATLTGFILPGEQPPRRSSIKRQLLFFDSVWIVDPSDSSLLNMGDISQKYPDGLEIQWTNRVPFPRSDGYTESIAQIVDETKRFQGMGLIKILLPTTCRKHVEPLSHWLVYQTSITDTNLVRAAVPDKSSGPPPVKMPSGVYAGGETYRVGPNQLQVSTVDLRIPAKLQDAELDWTHLAWSRLGRTLKYTRIAQSLDACPIALDEANESLCLALGSGSSPTTPALAQLADFAIALDVVDAEALDNGLMNMTWDEVIQLRKSVRPHVQRLRNVLVKQVRRQAGSSGLDLAAFRKELTGIKDQFRKAQDDLSKAWQEAGIALSGTLGGGLVAFPFTKMLDQTIVGIMAAATLSATLVKELKTVIPARQKVRKHPLFFFDRLPTKI
jgi:hypothetical protein